MIILAGAIGGVLWGAYLAKRRDGSTADMIQYAAGFAIAFALLGLLLSILIERIFL